MTSPLPSSSWFRKLPIDSLFGGQFREAEHDEVVLSTVDGTIVNCLIEFAYTGNIRIDAKNGLALLHASNYFGVDFVEKSCTDFLKSCIDDDSCLMILQKADTFALEHLRKVAKRHALRNFTNASKSNGFFNPSMSTPQRTTGERGHLCCG